MGQLVNSDFTYGLDIVSSYFNNGSNFRMRQVVANPFDGCNIVSLERTVIGGGGGGGTSDEIGEIRVFSYELVKDGYVMCNGASYSAEVYPLAFARLGYKWGGSGLNFNVPDFRNRALIGAELSNLIGAYLGDDQAIFSHTHSMSVIINDHVFTPTIASNLGISSSNVDVNININGSTAETELVLNDSAAVTLANAGAAETIPLTGTVASTALTVNEGDFEDHTDIIVENTPHTHDVTIPLVDVNDGEKTTQVGNDGTYTSTSHAVTIDLSTQPLRHNLVGGMINLTHSHTFTGTGALNTTHTHTGTAEVSINDVHSHAFTVTGTASAAHTHALTGDVAGIEATLTHEALSEMNPTSITIDIIPPSAKVWIMIKLF